MKKVLILVFAAVCGSLVSCGNEERADGYGNFEATEITVSSEAAGRIEFLNEGNAKTVSLLALSVLVIISFASFIV